MLADGRGAGLQKKVQALEMWRSRGLDTADAYAKLNLEADPRSYERVADVLRYLDVGSVRLLTNNPRKVQGLEKAGIQVKREPLEIRPTPHSRSYLLAKKLKMGHFLSHPALEP
jgi:GTP cyclohydrolase II